MSNITLIGMPGSGKSTVGVLLAKALGRGFLDTDLVIQQQENALLQDILDRRGVTYFLDAEERAVRSVRCDHCVIAPGGSVVCREGAINHLKSMGPVIYLRVPLDELKSRIHNLDSRGIALEPGQTLEDILTLRAPPCTSSTPTEWWTPCRDRSWLRLSLMCWPFWRRASPDPSPRGSGSRPENAGRPWIPHGPEQKEGRTT